MKRSMFKAPRLAREKRPCEIIGLADCLETSCHHWNAGKCSWCPSSERQAEAVRS